MNIEQLRDKINNFGNKPIRVDASATENLPPETPYTIDTCEEFETEVVITLAAA